MRINKILVLAMAVAVAMPLMAQKKTAKPAAPKPAAKQETPKQQKTEAFVGTILYTAEMNQPGKQPVVGKLPAPPAAKGKVMAVSAESLSVAAPAPTPKPEEMKFQKECMYAFEKGLCTAVVPYMFLQFNMKERMVTQGVRIEEPMYRAASFKLCKQKMFDCELMDKVASLQTAGNSNDANEILAKYYKRTEDSKEILGMKAVRYEMTFTKGSLWVVEDMTLDSWFAPFWGMNHPVLECDLPLMAEGCEEVTIHLTASKMIEKENLVKEEMIKEREEVEYPEMEGMMRQLADFLRR